MKILIKLIIISFIIIYLFGCKMQPNTKEIKDYNFYNLLKKDYLL